MSEKKYMLKDKSISKNKSNRHAELDLASHTKRWRVEPTMTKIRNNGTINDILNAL